MDKQQRQQADLFAKLVAIVSLDTLAGSEKLRLVEDAEHARLGDMTSVLSKFSTPISTNPHAARSWPFPGEVPLTWDRIVHVHPHVRRLLPALLNGEPVSLRGLPSFARPVLMLSPTKRFVLFFPEREADADTMTVAFVQSLQQVPFPYRRCPCGTIFVPFHRQLYCSLACPSRGADSPRSKKRREYMRQYMARLRKKARRKKGTGPTTGTPATRLH